MILVSLIAIGLFSIDQPFRPPSICRVDSKERNGIRRQLCWHGGSLTPLWRSLGLPYSARTLYRLFSLFRCSTGCWADAVLFSAYHVCVCVCGQCSVADTLVATAAWMQQLSMLRLLLTTCCSHIDDARGTSSGMGMGLNETNEWYFRSMKPNSMPVWLMLVFLLAASAGQKKQVKWTMHVDFCKGYK